MTLADSNNPHLKRPFQSKKNCQCVSCPKVLQRDRTTLCSAADTWSNHIAAPCDTLSIDNSPDPSLFAEVLLACKTMPVETLETTIFAMQHQKILLISKSRL